MVSLKFGVLHGSVLEPLLFIINGTNRWPCCSIQSCKQYKYADDNQGYIQCRYRDVKRATSKIESCIAEINNWMASNWLKLKSSNTKFILFALSQGLTKFEKVPLVNWWINPATSTKNHLSNDFKLGKLVSNICRTCFCPIRQIRHIHWYFIFEAASTLVSSFIMNCIDYCYSLLATAPVYQTNLLQWVLNSAARLHQKVSKFARELFIKVRDQLHWLWDPKSLSYKLCTLSTRHYMVWRQVNLLSCVFLFWGKSTILPIAMALSVSLSVLLLCADHTLAKIKKWCL